MIGRTKASRSIRVLGVGDAGQGLVRYDQEGRTSCVLRGRVRLIQS